MATSRSPLSVPIAAIFQDRLSSAGFFGGKSTDPWEDSSPNSRTDPVGGSHLGKQRLEFDGSVVHFGEPPFPSAAQRTGECFGVADSAFDESALYVPEETSLPLRRCQSREDECKGTHDGDSECN